MSDDIPSCGTRLVEILSAYGVDTVFGMPGVHTLEAYRGLPGSAIRHIGVRHEQGAGFMADGYARVSGKPGVCLLISGPGVTNAATPLGQAYSDSQPMLLLSSVAAVRDLGMHRGRLHEIRDQARVTEPLTAFSQVALSVEQVHELVDRAFALFRSARPRPVHISLPLDVIATPDPRPGRARPTPRPPLPDPDAIAEAASLLAGASRPMIVAGGGTVNAAEALTRLAEKLGAPVIPTIAAKGVIPDGHPLALETTLDRPATQAFLASADVVLAIGTELAEPDVWLDEPFPFSGALIRIDIDPAVTVQDYDVALAIVGDARAALEDLVDALDEFEPASTLADGSEVISVRVAEREALTPLERKHVVVLEALRAALPDDGMVFGDMTQIVYTAYAFFPVSRPRSFFFPTGYGTLGFALPAAIGGQLAAPDRPTVVLVGDGGLLFTVQELATAVEQKLPLAIVLWNNDSLAQIRDGMRRRNIPEIGVNQLNPDYGTLAKAFGCRLARPDSLAEFADALKAAFAADGPTLIELNEDAPFLAAND
ncbi:5-guanidino-2-oxopentanoate decarboxylase [Segnochrobactrum spirostomi]|uniref:5-guanidino-2-oxopentanoate decarboxylase n=1 Tax=Segnochrobactrum spirostomi TaxID=2608987 RepID=A0A6A7Y6H8_9HYPH|nr:5-guanidino-2-oxopentanoate decarboxylase [Segnochrobactrum spirostomi]MQT14910.1 5-guanidino-2-oxopentanoate decarboxylase [Segnochrobactrum spirostomi]